MTRAERTRVAAYALSTDDAGRILLCRIAPSVAPGEIWTLPGGGLEFGEPPEVAVLRELAEESGYEGEVVGLADVTDRVVTDSEGGGRMHAIRIVYRVRVTGGELRDEVDGSTDTCAWFTLDEASRLNLGGLAQHALSLAEAGARADASATADEPAAPTTRAPDRCTARSPSMSPLRPSSIFSLARDVERWELLLPHYARSRARERRADGSLVVDFVARRPLIGVLGLGLPVDLAIAHLERAGDVPAPLRARGRGHEGDGRHLADRRRRWRVARLDRP